METNEEKGRRSATVSQRRLLVKAMATPKNIALTKLRTKEGREQARQLWSEIADILNAEGPARSSREWQVYWNEWSAKILRKLRNNRKANVSKKLELDPLENFIAEILEDKEDNTPLAGVEEESNDNAKVIRLATASQRRLLVRTIASCKDWSLLNSRTKEGREQSHKMWQRIAETLNAEGPARTPKEWNMYWNDMKSKIKRKKQRNREATSMSDIIPLDPVEDLVSDIIKASGDDMPLVQVECHDVNSVLEASGSMPPKQEQSEEDIQIEFVDSRYAEKGNGNVEEAPGCSLSASEDDWPESDAGSMTPRHVEDTQPTEEADTQSVASSRTRQRLRQNAPSPSSGHPYSRIRLLRAEASRARALADVKRQQVAAKQAQAAMLQAQAARMNANTMANVGRALAASLEKIANAICAAIEP